jgi:hypothetical protein
VNRPEYATALALASAQIVAAVHRAEPDEIRHHTRVALSLTAPADVDPFEALVTVLAAQISPDTSLSERLLWTVVLPQELVA